MVCLHVSITNDGGDGYQITCDNLRREDATDKEIAMANIMEQITGEAMKGIADKVRSFKQTQSGPCAENEEVK